MTEQGILNHSVDPQFGVVAIELLGYDPVNNVLRRIPVKADGTLQLNGAHKSTNLTYISGTGTAGTDDTAAVLYTAVLPADSLTVVGDRIRVRQYWTGDTGSAITGSSYVGPSGSEVLVGHTTDGGAANLQIVETWLHYIDNTHANIIETESGALGDLSAPNVAGFTWNADQHIEFRQNQILNNHCILYAMIVDIFPKAT
jgi:hypothetical protein